LEHGREDIRIGFLQHGSETSPGTRVRVLYVVKYIENGISSKNTDDLVNCDVVIFQKRYKREDVIFAKWLKSQGKKVLVDLCDPVWDKDYPGVYFPITGDIQEDFKELLKLSDLVMLCTPRLQEMFNEHYSAKNIVLIDRFDLDIHKADKVHTNKNKPIILWHGSKFNVPSLNIARDGLERLHKDIDFKLVVIHEAGAEKLKSFSFKTEYKIWNLSTINKEIQKADITINTHEPNSYKSNGKTIKSLALGIPCVENNFYQNCNKLLTDIVTRKQIAKEGRQLVEKKYDSKLSAREIEDLCKSI